METTPGKRVQMLREAKGYTSLTAFAEFTKLKVGTLSALEKDKSSPSLETMAKLIEAFPDVNLDWLVIGAGSMFKQDKELTPASQLSIQMPSESQRINSDRELVRMMSEEDMRISGTSGPPYRMRSITRTPEEEMEYLRLELLRERQAHERTRERYETDRNQNHERETKLIALIGSGSFNDASPDAAVTYAAEMRVSYVNPDYQRFVPKAPEPYERRAVGFGAN